MNIENLVLSGTVHPYKIRAIIVETIQKGRVTERREICSTGEIYSTNLPFQEIQDRYRLYALRGEFDSLKDFLRTTKVPLAEYSVQGVYLDYLLRMISDSQYGVWKESSPVVEGLQNIRKLREITGVEIALPETRVQKVYESIYNRSFCSFIGYSIISELSELTEIPLPKEIVEDFRDFREKSELADKLADKYSDEHFWDEEEQDRLLEEKRLKILEEACEKAICSLPRYVTDLEEDLEKYEYDRSDLKELLAELNSFPTFSFNVSHRQSSPLTDVIQKKYRDILQFRRVGRWDLGEKSNDMSLCILSDLVKHTGIKPDESTVRKSFEGLLERQLLEALQGIINMTGFEPSGRYGLDSNVLIDLVLKHSARDYFQKAYADFPENKFFTIPTCLGEARRVLEHKYGYSLQNADFQLDEMVCKAFRIQKLVRIPTTREDANAVRQAGLKYWLNKSDIPIINYLWKAGVDYIIVRDRNFENTCNELSIPVLHWPLFL